VHRILTTKINFLHCLIIDSCKRLNNKKYIKYGFLSTFFISEN